MKHDIIAISLSCLALIVLFFLPIYSIAFVYGLNALQVLAINKWFIALLVLYGLLILFGFFAEYKLGFVLTVLLLIVNLICMLNGSKILMDGNLTKLIDVVGKEAMKDPLKTGAQLLGLASNPIIPVIPSWGFVLSFLLQLLYGVYCFLHIGIGSKRRRSEEFEYRKDDTLF